MKTAVKEATQELTVKEILKPFALAVLEVNFPKVDNYGNPTLGRFLFENGRLPYASDEVKPWKYRGWLIPYIQMCERTAKNAAMLQKFQELENKGIKPFRVPNIAPRYDYVLRTLEAGKLLDEPIPQIEFVGEFEQSTKSGLKMLTKCIEFVEMKSGWSDGIREFCEWLAFGLGVIPEQSKLSEEVQDFLYRNFNLEPLLTEPSDYLGQMLCESNYGKRNGFYPTPIHICWMMAEMVRSDLKGKDPRFETTMDPCVGTGRMLLVSSNFSLRLYGQDIDYLCCLISKINLALYAPWHYIPESFFEEKTSDSMNESKLQLKTESEPLNDQIEVSESEPTNEISLYEKLKREKDCRKRPRKFSTKIEEQLTLF